MLSVSPSDGEAPKPDLLFLSHRLPYPPDKGEKIRAWHILRHLSRSHRIHLGCLADEPVTPEHIQELHRFCLSIACFPIRSTVQKARALLKMRAGRPLTLTCFTASPYQNGLLIHSPVTTLQEHSLFAPAWRRIWPTIERVFASSI